MRGFLQGWGSVEAGKGKWLFLWWLAVVLGCLGKSQGLDPYPKEWIRHNRPSVTCLAQKCHSSSLSQRWQLGPYISVLGTVYCWLVKEFIPSRSLPSPAFPSREKVCCQELELGLGAPKGWQHWGVWGSGRVRTVHAVSPVVPRGAGRGMVRSAEAFQLQCLQSPFCGMGGSEG